MKKKIYIAAAVISALSLLLAMGIKTKKHIRRVRYI